MGKVVWDMNILDIVAIILAIISLIVSILIAKGIINVHTQTQKSSEHLVTLNNNLNKYNTHMQKLLTMQFEPNKSK